MYRRERQILPDYTIPQNIPEEAHEALKNGTYYINGATRCPLYVTLKCPPLCDHLEDGRKKEDFLVPDCLSCPIRRNTFGKIRYDITKEYHGDQVNVTEI